MAAKQLRNHPLDSVAASIVAIAEIRFGLLKNSASQLSDRLDVLLGRLPVAPFESPADLRYAELRADLERRGTPVGANDMLIAAHALALDCTLVTVNEREFRLVEGLTVENWTA